MASNLRGKATHRGVELRTRIIMFVLIAAAVLPSLPASADYVCRPFCAGGGVLSGSNLNLPLERASFKWSLSYRGVVAGSSETPRQMTSAARLHGVVDRVVGATAQGFGTITVFRENSTTNSLIAVPVRFAAAGAPASDGTLRIGSGAVVPIMAGGGYGATINLFDGSLNGLLHAPRVVEDQGSTVVVTIAAPSTFVPGERVDVSGTVKTASGAALPGVPVDVVVDDDSVETVVADSSGRWVASHTFADALGHSMQAVALRDSPAPASSVVRQLTPTQRLTTTVSGAGSIASSPAGIACGSTCAATFPHGSLVSLTATPAASSIFVGWTGACTGSGGCAVSMQGARSVAAAFTLKTYTLTVTRSGTGTGVVASSPSGISCGATCVATYTHGTVVTLTASPDVSSTFAGWSGACTGTASCVITMDQARAVTATFTLKSFVLTVTKTGTGTGTVTSSPAGVSCGSTCSASFPYGSSVTLTATPDVSSTFAGWSGGCAGTGSCTVTMSSNRSVTATFTLASHVLSVTKAGNGSGTVTSTPAGISCGSTCSAAYTYGTVVTLTAASSTSSTFAGWSGGCSGTGTCTVTMTAARSVTATFTLKTYVLSVTKDGAGAGTVSSTPAGISCGATCSAAFNHGTQVTLTASPDGSSDFSGWAGACTGTGACVVTMDQARSVTASFAQQTPLLSVTRSGNGSGSVTSSPVGISCGATCSAAYTYGTEVTLAATVGPYTAFAGWSGACTGSGACVVTMDQARSVTATFTLINADVVESEPNNTTADADPVPLPVRYAGALPGGPLDLDVVSFTVSAWTNLRAETFDPSLSTCSTIDTVIRLLNLDGTELYVDDDGGIDLCSLLDVALAPGTYYVEVGPYGANPSGNNTAIPDYRLQLIATPLTNAYEPNDTIGTASAITVPSHRGAAISPATDLDHYTFTLPVYEDLVAETFDGSGSTCAAINTVVTLYDAAGTQIGFDDDGGINLCSRLSVGLAAGTYTIKVEDYLNNNVIDAYVLVLSNSYYGT